MPHWLEVVIELLAQLLGLLALGIHQRRQHAQLTTRTAEARDDVGKLRELIKSSLRPPPLLGFDCEHEHHEQVSSMTGTPWDADWCEDCGAFRKDARSPWQRPGQDMTPKSARPPQRKG